MCYIMFVVAISYYGITLALGNLAGSLHLNFFLTALAEMPAYVAGIALIDTIGRRIVITSGMLLTAITLTLTVAISNNGLRLVFAMAGKFGSSIAWAFAIVYVSEMFPTVVRSLVLGMGNQAADVGGITTPLLLHLGDVLHFKALAWLVMGLSALVTAALVVGKTTR